MCGIAGIWSTSAGREPARLEEQVEAMLGAMLHRGPDQGSRVPSHGANASIVLGARRLAIQDLTDAGSQPMIDQETGNMIVFNGEVYNFRDLQRRIGAEGGVTFSGCDTEVVLRGYAMWGPDVVALLRGMFAFAIWDRSKQVLFLARDRLGVKPLYYHYAPGTFAFASEIRALLKGSAVSPALNPDGVRSYLAFGAVSEPATIIQGVRAFPPGHYGYVRPEGLANNPYWNLEQAFADNRTSESPNDLPEQLQKLLSESVRLRLVSDAPTGIFLSGGLDSTVIAVLAAEHSERAIRTVSIIFREPEFSEKPWIDRTVSHIGSMHSEIEVSDLDLLGLIPNALSSFDQPTVDAVNTYVVSMHAHMAGLTAALSGIGGDELFGGYPAFDDVPRLRLVRRTIPVALLRPSIWLLGHISGRNDRIKKLSQYLLTDGADGIEAELIHRELFVAADRQSLTALYPPSPITDMAKGIWIPPQFDSFNALSYAEMSGYMLNMLLRDTDFASMASSLEVREPYLDHEFVAAVASLPGSVKQGPERKSLLRRIARRIVPESLIQPTKRGFSLPMDRWIHGGLHSEVGSVLRDRTISYQLSQIISHDAVERVWSDFDSNRTSWTRPWALYVLKSWAGSWLQ
jgi:asparagine synthase (glutamine-hydrolysing)